MTQPDYARSELLRLRDAKHVEITRLERLAKQAEDDAKRYAELAALATADLESLYVLIEEVTNG